MAAYREQTVEITLGGAKAALENGNIGTLTKEAAMRPGPSHPAR